MAIKSNNEFLKNAIEEIESYFGTIPEGEEMKNES